MDKEQLLSYSGITGGIATALGVVVYLVRNVLRSKCVRGSDGALHLDVSFNTAEIETIKNDDQLKHMLQELKAEILRKSHRGLESGSADV